MMGPWEYIKDEQKGEQLKDEKKGKRRKRSVTHIR